MVRQISHTFVLAALAAGLVLLPRPSHPSLVAQTDKQPAWHTVVARVDYAQGGGVGILAERVPGDFEVPPGSEACDLKYQFSDPKSGYESQRLGPSNIYSVTERRYMREVAGNPQAKLPAGEYKFVVGGQPGAVGTLSYRLQAVSDGGVKPVADRTLEVIVWADGHDDYKVTAVYHIRGSDVTGEMDCTWDGPSGENFRSEPWRHTGKFTGRYAQGVITGTWETKHWPQTWQFVDTRRGVTYQRVDQGRSTLTIRLELLADGKVRETLKGHGFHEWQWSANAPETLAGKHDSNSYETTIPSEHFPQPLTGTWREIKSPPAATTNSTSTNTPRRNYVP